MLNIERDQSQNSCYISGILNELDIKEGTTSDGRQYVSGTAKIRVDQEIDGKVVENVIPIHMFSMRNKSDGNLNAVYDRIVGYKDNFLSAAAAEDKKFVSKVTISGEVCNITENMFYDKNKKEIISGFQISSNFLNNSRSSDEEKATFELSGVVLNTSNEIKNDEETGRLIVSLGVVKYNGEIDKIDLIATGNAKAHIESNWEKGDTVVACGIINVSQDVKRWKEELGFGEPIERVRTITKRELLITSGSASGLEEFCSYDQDDVKQALARRKARQEAIKERATKNKTHTVKKDNDFGF